MDEISSPEFRAAVLSEVLKQASLIPGDVTFTALFNSVMQAIKKPEEECSLEIQAAVFMLVRSGILESDHFDAVGKMLTIGSETVLKPSRGLIQFMWAESVFEPSIREPS